jgi:hypothetical protein
MKAPALARDRDAGDDIELETGKPTPRRDAHTVVTP